MSARRAAWKLSWPPRRADVFTRSSISRRRSRTGGSGGSRVASPTNSSSSSGSWIVARPTRASGYSAATSAGPSRRSACALAPSAFTCRRFSSRKRRCSLSPMRNSQARRGGRIRGPSVRCRAQRRVRRRLPCVACARWDSLSRRSRSSSGLTRSRAPLGPKGAGAIDATDALLADLGWRRDDAHHILRALGFARVREGEGAERALFRRRATSEQSTLKAGPAETPFAALAALTKPAERRTRRRKRRRRPTVGRAAS